MKKHDEGYVLAYVTVVLLIFCLVATTILTGALHNLQSQQKAIARMQDQYAAEGMIEKVVAQRTAYSFSTDTDFGNPNIACTEVDGDDVTLTVTYNTVMIKCTFDKRNGDYSLYEISTVEPTPTESGGGSE